MMGFKLNHVSKRGPDGPNVNIFSGNGLLSGVTKPLPEQIFTITDASKLRKLFDKCHNYRKISNNGRTKSPNLNVTRLVMQLSLSNPMQPGVKSRMKL